MNKDRIWKDTLNIIRISVSQAAFSTWFLNTFIVSVKKLNNKRQIVEIGCPSSFVADTLEKRYFGIIQDSLNEATGLKNDITFSVRQKVSTEKETASPLFTIPQNDIEDNDVLKQALASARVRPGFTFENFAVSGTNQMAWAAAEAVSKNLANTYNPLFIWGGVGVGKTHLVLAIAHRVLSENIDTPVLYCMGEEFTNEIVEAIRNKTTQSFKNRYRKLKLLIVDDIQFLAGKNAVQEEFFHTFNTLQREGGQIVLTSDRPPSEIERLEERLKSRFEAGLIIDIAPPDFELRTAIALIKSQEKGLNLSMEEAQAIAASLDSARKIEGFITKLLTYKNLKQQPITNEIIEKLLSEGVVRNDIKKRLTPNDFIGAITQYYSLGKRKLMGTSRIKSIVLPRQILMYLLRVELGMSLQEIGRVVGGRDHTTVMHAVEKISKNLSTDNVLREDILRIKKLLFG